MGESVNDIPSGEDKMEETASSSSGLQVSVSFGRFENDSLSWEKFSSFSPNKYLEEVEKCATPGSVAQKKAYFEAHYKKIAERKFELMDQEKQLDKKESTRSSDQNHEVPSVENSGVESELSVYNDQCSCEEDKHVNGPVSKVNKTDTNQSNEETEIVKECQSPVEDVKEEVDGNLDSPELEKPEDVVEVKEEVKQEIASDDRNDILSKNLKKEEESSPKIKERSVKMDRIRAFPKIAQVDKKTVTNRSTQVSKERNKRVTKKKPVSPASRAPGFSTPRVSKPASTFTSMSLSRSSTKNENISTLTSNKNPSAAEGKQMAPKSLHMSLSLGPSNSDPTALRTTRKSLIMEKMGDKDIVKRAFKTFQSSYKQSKPSSHGHAAVPNKILANAANVSSLGTARKEDRGSVKAVGVEKKSAKAMPSSFGLKSKEIAEKRKQFSKNIGEKTDARGVDRTRMQIKPKEGDVKSRRQSLDSKVKLMHNRHFVQKVSKGSSEKEGSKNEGHG